MLRRHPALLSAAVVAVLSFQTMLPSRVCGQDVGNEPDLLQLVRKRQELADMRAVGEALGTLTQALLVRPWYPPLAEHLLASAQVNVFTDLDASCECKQQLFRLLGWFLAR